MHQLIAQVPINSTKLEELKETDTFTTRSTSKYNLYHFYKVVINTRALKYSIARYKQF
jgi:hypothetical protein